MPKLPAARRTGASDGRPLFEMAIGCLISYHIISYHSYMARCGLERPRSTISYVHGMRSPRSLKRFATSGSENDGSLMRVPIHASRRIAVLDMYPCEDKLGHIHTPSASACFACCTALPGTGALGEEGVRPFCASSKRARCVASRAAARSAFAKRSFAICARDRRSSEQRARCCSALPARADWWSCNGVFAAGTQG